MQDNALEESIFVNFDRTLKHKKNLKLPKT